MSDRKPVCEACQRAKADQAVGDRVMQASGCVEAFQLVKECMDANSGQVKACIAQWDALSKCLQQQ